MEKQRLKSILIIITYTVVLFMLLSHFSAVTNVMGGLFDIIVPFIYGICIAYILNIPYVFFSEKVFGRLRKKGSEPGKWVKPLALASTYVSVLLALFLIVWFIIPQLGSSIALLVKSIPAYLGSLQNAANNLIDELNIRSMIGTQTSSSWNNFLQQAASMVSSILQGAAGYVLSLTNSIYNWLIGFIVSVYLLSGKETLLRQVRKVMKAYLPEKWNDNIMEVCGRTNYIFKNYIKGSVMDSIVVGILCFIGMSIMGIPYALLVSVIQAITNLIPIFGPFLGAVPSTFIILMDDPVKAAVFVVFIIILQQIDGNIIQPRIVGDNIGLPGIWVLFAIVVGSGTFGIPGLIIGVPTAAVLYGILKKSVNSRLQ